MVFLRGRLVNFDLSPIFGFVSLAAQAALPVFLTLPPSCPLTFPA